MKKYDIAIIGGGPAGLTAALYASRAGYSVCLFEKEALGGQVNEITEIDNYPGIPKISGSALSQLFCEQYFSLGADEATTIFEEATSISYSDNGEKDSSYIVKSDSESIESSYVILATGSSHRKLNVLGENLRGVHYCATCDGALYKNRVVVVVGGGDSALSEALYLSKICKEVFLVHRRSKFKAKSFLIDKVQETPNISVKLNSNIKEVKGSDRVEEVVFDSGEGIKCEGVFVAIGRVPNIALLGSLNKEGLSKLQIIGDCSLSIDRVRQVTTACADGITAVDKIIKATQI